MESAQAWTVGVGVLGLLTTVGVAIFTQVYQGRREDRRHRRSRDERQAEKWLDARYALYRRVLENMHRHKMAYRGIRRPLTSERRKEQGNVAFEMSQLMTELLLLAPPEVIDAMRTYDRAAAACIDPYNELWKHEPDTPEWTRALEDVKGANRAMAEPESAVQQAMRDDLGTDARPWEQMSHNRMHGR